MIFGLGLLFLRLLLLIVLLNQVVRTLIDNQFAQFDFPIIGGSSSNLFSKILSMSTFIMSIGCIIIEQVNCMLNGMLAQINYVRNCLNGA